LAAKILDYLDQHRDSDAAELSEKLTLADLSPLERKLTEKRLVEVRRHAAENRIKSAKNDMTQGRDDEALADLQRALALDVDARLSQQAQSLLGLAQWHLQRYADAEPALRAALKTETDRAVVEDLRYALASTLAHLNRAEDAKSAFSQIVTGGGKFVGSAKVYMAALENQEPMPADLPGGKVRAAEVKPAAAVAPAAATPPAVAPASASNP
jgi:hypothetical protein